MRSLSTRTAGLLILALGAWGGIAPFIGHYFHFALGPDKSWAWTTGRLYLSVLPGAAAVLGGLMLIGAGWRPSARLGALLAIAAGIWFAIGPDVSHLWNAAGAQGAAHGSKLVRVLEMLAYHTLLGSVLAALGGYALPRFVAAPVAAAEPATARRGTERHAARDEALAGGGAAAAEREREREPVTTALPAGGGAAGAGAQCAQVLAPPVVAPPSPRSVSTSTALTMNRRRRRCRPPSPRSTTGQDRRFARRRRPRTGRPWRRASTKASGRRERYRPASRWTHLRQTEPASTPGPRRPAPPAPPRRAPPAPPRPSPPRPAPRPGRPPPVRAAVRLHPRRTTSTRTEPAPSNGVAADSCQACSRDAERPAGQPPRPASRSHASVASRPAAYVTRGSHPSSSRALRLLKSWLRPSTCTAWRERSGRVRSPVIPRTAR